MDRLELNAEPRSVLGKKVRFLRRQGIVPANVYGHADSTAIQAPVKETERVLARAGRTQLISLTMNGGEATTVMVKASQKHPIKRTLLHVDFFRVAMTELMKIDIPLRLVGEAPAIRQHDGVLNQAASTVSVESLPADLPEAIDVDVSGLAEIDSALHVRDLTAPAGVTILADPDELVVKVMAPTVQAEDEPTTEEAAVTAEGGETTEATTETSSS